MHGRLKIKTTAEQQAEKDKEREKKKQKYLEGMNIVFQKRKANQNDETAMEVTANLLMANPDAQSLWNFRREMVLTFIKEKQDDAERSVQDILNKELMLTETCLLQNPKSYGAWHHRAWALNESPSPPWKHEMELCDKYLTLDNRNFHCWDHRRLVVEKSGRSLAEELDYSLKLINDNFSNYSAWHYRSCLLPILHPPTEDSPLPIEQTYFVKELTRVVSAVFTDPSDQSPWFFLRWLICFQPPSPRVLQAGLITQKDHTSVIVTFTLGASKCDLDRIDLKIDESIVNGDWEHLDTHRKIWRFSLKDCLSGSTITISSLHFSEQFRLDEINQPRWICNDSLSTHNLLPEPVKQSFQQLIDDCLTLDEIDPDSKWVLLTLVDLMKAFDCQKYHKEILAYLSRLQKIDHLRARYYDDMKSSVNFTTAMQSFITQKQTKFSMVASDVSNINTPQYLALVSEIDLSSNDFSSCIWARDLIGCSTLVLDGNPITDLSGLKECASITVLSLKSCGLSDPKQLEPLRSLTSLAQVNLQGNAVAEPRTIEKDLKFLIPNLEKVFI